MYAKHRSPSRDSDPTADANIALGYLFRYVEEEVNHIAAQSGTGTTAADLAARLAALLHHKAEWTLLDGGKRVQEVRGSAAQGHEERPAKTALHVRARNGRPLAQGRTKTTAPRTKTATRMYQKMDQRLRASTNPKLRAQAIKWFKRHHPDSVVLKQAA